MEACFYDRTSRGRLLITGRDRGDLVHRLCTNDVMGLEEGQGRSGCFLTNKGRLIDWTVILNRGDDLLILSGNPDRLAGHIQEYTISEDVTVRNYMAVELVVCGPGSGELLGVDLEPWAHATVRLGEVEVLVARVEPLLGEAYAILAPDAVALRRSLARHARPLSEEESRRIRVRSGIPAFPNEINESHNPWEARLDDAISLHKGCYVGQEVVARLKTYDKVQRRLAGLRLASSMQRGDSIYAGDEEVGVLTTVAGEIALGYVGRDYLEPGTELEHGVQVVALPFGGTPADSPRA